MPNTAQRATTLKAVSRLPHILGTDNATMRETHRGPGQVVSEDVQVSPNVNPLDNRIIFKRLKRWKFPNSIRPKLGRQRRPPTEARSRETRATFETRVDNNRS